ncbi:MAG: right-handed parallel beta-helix repeat-containing protein [Bacteroidales bacterium]
MGNCEKSGVYLLGMDTLIVRNNDISNNTEHGVTIYGGLPQVNNNTIEQNGLYPIYVTRSSVLNGEIYGNSSSQA